MSSFRSILMLAVATVSVSACSSSSQDTAYLGSRDDIIVSNSGATKVAETAIKSETQTAKAEMETAVKVDVTEAKADVEKTITSEVTTISMDNQPMDAKPMDAEPMEVKPMETVAMKPVMTEKVSSETSSVSPAAGVPATPPGATEDVPPNARPGECYAKVLIPAITESKSQRIQVSEEQKVLDRIIPAKYEVTTERVKVKEARQFWKAGTGPITKKDEVTGKILCLVEEPAEYKTIEKRVLVEPEKPQYKTVPAKFETVTTQNVIKAESWEWRRILCETNLSSAAIMQIQRALNSKGYNVAPDGRLGNKTMNAINSYQLKNGLASRGITYETLSHLGVKLEGA